VYVIKNFITKLIPTRATLKAEQEVHVVKPAC